MNTITSEPLYERDTGEEALARIRWNIDIIIQDGKPVTILYPETPTNTT